MVRAAGMRNLRLLALLLLACSGGGGGGTAGGTGTAGSGTGGTGTGGAGGTGGSGGSAGGALPSLPLAEVCAQLAEARCSREVRCQRLDPADKPTCLARDVEACGIPNDVAKGTAAYDGTAAAACVAAMATQDCGDVNDVVASPGTSYDPERCDDIVQSGRGQAGTPCVTNAHCQADAGLYCQINDFVRCRQCAARVPTGSFCAFDVHILCQPGNVCDELGRTDGGRCQRVPRLLGETCTAFSMPCASDGGLYCRDPGDGGQDSCQPRLGAGQGPCVSATAECQPNHYCEVVTDGGVRTCRPLRLANQSCSGSAPCAQGLFCQADAGNTCRPVRQLDQACTTTGTYPCDQGLFCQADAGPACKPLQGDGAPCTSGAQCASSICTGAAVAGVTAQQRCGYFLGLAPCWRHSDCGPGNHCRGYRPQRTDAGVVLGACSPLSGDGGACTQEVPGDSCSNPDEVCLEGRCRQVDPFSRMLGQSCDLTSTRVSSPMCGNGTRCSYADPVTGEGTCVMPLNDGEACREDNDCRAGSYCNRLAAPDVCVPLARRGQRCSAAAGPGCARELTCNAVGDGGFECGPYVTAGAPCGVTSGPVCTGSYCAADAGQCTARGVIGAMCSAAAQCASGACVNPDGGAGGAPGATCQLACY